MMERLTGRIGKTVYYAQGKYYKETLACECDADDVRNILQKLAEYEDLELTPSEIKEIFEEIHKTKEVVHKNSEELHKEPDEIKELAKSRLDDSIEYECGWEQLSFN